MKGLLTLCAVVLGLGAFGLVAGCYARQPASEGPPTAAERTSKAEHTATDAPHGEQTAYDPPAQAPRKQAGLFFPQLSGPSKDHLGALGGGKLLVRNRCLYMGTRRHAVGVVVWPYGYSLRKQNGEILILNGRSEVVAKVGEEVRMGGGQITQEEAGSTPEAARRQFEEKRGELGVPDRCRGPLWVSSGVMTRPEK